MACFNASISDVPASEGLAGPAVVRLGRAALDVVAAAGGAALWASVDWKAAEAAAASAADVCAAGVALVAGARVKLEIG